MEQIHLTPTYYSEVSQGPDLYLRKYVLARGHEFSTSFSRLSAVVPPTTGTSNQPFDQEEAQYLIKSTSS